MKKTVAVLTAMLMLWAFACNNSQKNKEKKSPKSEKQVKDSAKTAKQEKNEKEEPPKAAKQPKESAKSTKKEKEASDNRNVKKFSELKEGAAIMGLTLSDYKYNPKSEWAYAIEGMVRVSGEFYFNEMAEALHFKPGKRQSVILDFNSYQRPLISDMYFTNSDRVKQVLGSDKVSQIQSGNRIKATIKIDNFSAKGKIDGYAGASAKFIDLLSY